MHRVLVVDDDPDWRGLLQRWLTRLGCSAVAAESGLEALVLLDQLEVDLVLLDVRMPGLDGIETCRRLRSRPELETLPVLFVSSETGPEIRLLGAEAGANEWIAKPVVASELARRLQPYLHLSSA